MKKRINKILWYGDELSEGKAKAPNISVNADGLDGLNEGEVFIANNEADPAIFIRTSSGKVVRIGGADLEVLKKLFLSKTEDDTAEGKITFKKGIGLPVDLSEENSSEEILSEENSSEEILSEENSSEEILIHFIDKILTEENASVPEKYSDDTLMTAAAFAKLFKLEKDGEGNIYIRTPFPFASDKAISTLGIGDSGEGGLYSRLDSWEDYKEGDGSVLSSELGHDLLTRVESIGQGGGEGTIVADKTFLFTQGTASKVWVITHDLNKYPSVTVMDSGGSIIVGDVVYDSVNQITVSFSAEFAGTATLN